MGNYFLDRVSRLKERIALKSSECFFTSKCEDVHYLIGFNSSNSNLFITQDKIKLLTDRRYIQQVRNVPSFVDINFVELNFIDSIKRIVNELRIKKVYLEPSKISYGKYLELRKIKGLHWSRLRDQLNYVFAYHDEDAIKKTKNAVKLTELIFNEILGEIKEGISENELQAELKYKILKNAKTKITFEPIVLFGKNSAYPHGVSSKFKLKKNSPILIDFGLSIDGFTSDFTRTIFFGKPDSNFLKYYSIIRDALVLAIDNLEINTKARTLYEIVVNHFSKFNLQNNFTHGLGHGIGIYLHNFPQLSKNSKDLIKENLVIAIEPALYFENMFGIRIEQDIFITKEKKVILTKTTDELIIL